MVNKTFFSDLLVDRGMSLRQLAKRLDVLPSQLSLTFNGKRRMQMAEAVRISQVLGAPLSEVMAAAGIAEATSRRCRVEGILGGDGFVAPVGEGEIERVLVPDGLPEGCTAVQARTLESQLAWMDGWVFFCNGAQPPEELAGRFCLVTLADDRRLLATVRRGYATGTFNLSGPVTILSQRVKSASPVLMTRN